MIQHLSEALFPLLALIALGAFLGRRTDFFDGRALSGLVTTVGIPALLLHSVLSMDMAIAGMGALVGITVAWLVVMSAVTALVLWAAGLPVRSYLPALVHPNTGNMGIPVCFALLGPESLGLAVVISSVIQVSHFTLGIGCLSGRFSVRDLLRNGPVLALIFGALLLATGLRLPSPVMTTLDLLGSITIPVMLMLLGSSIASLKRSGAKDMLRPLAFSVYRPLAGLALAWLLLLVWPLTDLEAQVFLIQCAMSVAVMSYVLAVRYQGPSQEIALTIPLSLIVSLGVVVVFAMAMTGCDAGPGPSPQANAAGHSVPSASTTKANQQVLEQRPFDNRDDFADARRGLIAQDPELVIGQLEGGEVWNMGDYGFIDAEGEQAPAAVNPSLWRQAALNNIHGLFEVTDGLYQVRGYDLANMTIIEGDTGWILVDPLTARETASKAWLFARKHLGDKPVRAILYTHSHIDHFGGVQGILQHLSPEERAQLRIIAPEGFADEATSENIIAGPAMTRRAMFMYGKRLARDERGHVGTGLGKGPAFGTFGFAEPTDLIRETGTEMTVDGVAMVFQMVSGSEAPAEFTFYLPGKKAFGGAELVSRNLHNLYTLRGAKVRDARLWSGFIDQARTRFADAEVYFGSHHWPLWGQQKIQEFLAKQRDTYKFIHDQTVRLMNQGATPREIAQQLQLPPALNQDFHNQGYYGTVSHNAKAVYQHYLGWFSANPAQLDPLPESDSAARYVRMMGGAQRVLETARQDFAAAAGMGAAEGRDTYRWLAELLNHLVFAEPDNETAKQLLASVYDQLGYQAESAPWRDFYLTGAYELRHGSPEEGIKPAKMRELLLNTPVTLFFDSMAVRLKAEDAEGESATIKIAFTDLEESYLLTLQNSVLHHRLTSEGTPADATLKLTRPLFVDFLIGNAGLKELLFSDDISFEGSRLALIGFFGMLDKPEGRFNIVTP